MPQEGLKLVTSWHAGTLSSFDDTAARAPLREASKTPTAAMLGLLASRGLVLGRRARMLATSVWIKVTGYVQNAKRHFRPVRPAYRMARWVMGAEEQVLLTYALLRARA